MTFSKEANQNKYPFTLPELPYSKDALMPLQGFQVSMHEYSSGKMAVWCFASHPYSASLGERRKGPGNLGAKLNYHLKY